MIINRRAMDTGSDQLQFSISPVKSITDRVFLAPVAKTRPMKMLAVVAIIKVIIGMIEKNKKTMVAKKETKAAIIHPSEFRIR